MAASVVPKRLDARIRREAGKLLRPEEEEGILSRCHGLNRDACFLKPATQRASQFEIVLRDEPPGLDSVAEPHDAKRTQG